MDGLMLSLLELLDPESGNSARVNFSFWMNAAARWMDVKNSASRVQGTSGSILHPPDALQLSPFSEQGDQQSRSP